MTKTYKGGFLELQGPTNADSNGWYVAADNRTHNDSWYLHSDLELYRTTSSVDGNSFPGYFSTLVEANEMRYNYYIKYHMIVIKPYNQKAFDRAMKGI